MKASEARLLSALAAPPADIRLFLLHGPDEAGAMALATRLGTALGVDAERVDLDGAALRNDPARLADEAASMSLFGGQRWVRVTGAGEEVLGAVETLLGAAQAGNPVMVIAPGVKTSGKLVKLAIAAPAALAFACYQPEGRNAETAAAEVARGEGLRFDPAALRQLIDACDGDRAVMTREIQKIALYLDAAPDRPREADGAVLDAVGAGLSVSALGEIVEAVVSRDATALGSALRDADPADAIPTMRALQRRLAALADMRAAVDAGDGPEQVVKRSGVFWKEEAATIAALRRWSAADIARAHAAVRTSERAVMSGRDAARVIGEAMLLAIARR